MRTVRLVIAVLLGFALAAAPIAPGFAMAPTAQSKVGAEIPAAQHHDMMAEGASDDACSRCNVSHDSPAAFCLLKCCSVAAIVVDAPPLTGPQAAPDADTVVAALTPFSSQPDPPPPRS